MRPNTEVHFTNQAVVVGPATATYSLEENSVDEDDVTLTEEDIFLVKIDALTEIVEEHCKELSLKPAHAIMALAQVIGHCMAHGEVEFTPSALNRDGMLAIMNTILMSAARKKKELSAAG